MGEQLISKFFKVVFVMKKAGVWICLIVFSVLLMNSWYKADSKDQKKRIKKRVAVFIFDDKTDKSLRWWNKK